MDTGYSYDSGGIGIRLPTHSAEVRTLGRAKLQGLRSSLVFTLQGVMDLLLTVSRLWSSDSTEQVAQNTGVRVTSSSAGITELQIRISESTGVLGAHEYLGSEKT